MAGLVISPAHFGEQEFLGYSLEPLSDCVVIGHRVSALTLSAMAASLHE
jgi:hypothetical protein